MKFLNKLLSTFRKSQETNAAPQQVFDYISPHGSVGRFAFDKKRDFYAENGKPRPKVFSPETHPETKQIETSVCGLNNVSNDRVHFLGDTIRTGLNAVGYVEITVSKVVECRLECKSAPEDNYDEHGVIVGWNEDKAEQKIKCLDLVANYTSVKIFNP